MKLKQIKLAGFKTFVDPTKILLDGQLAGIVGPNGCGKSNIMESVKWVLGHHRPRSCEVTQWMQSYSAVQTPEMHYPELVSNYFLTIN